VETVNFVTDIDSLQVAEQLRKILQSISTVLQTSPGLAAALQPTLDALMVNINNFTSATQPAASSTVISVADLTSQFGKALGFMTKILGPTFSALASLFFTFLISLQMTLTAAEVKNWYADLIPPGFNQEYRWIIDNIRQIWTGFLRGQMLLMLIIGTVIWLGGLILGLPHALLLGIVAGVMELIPNVGPTLAAVPAVLLALLFGSTTLEINSLVFALLVVGFYVVVQLLENQFLVPRIMGDAVDLPPLIVLIGTIAGASAFGILGALLATPFIATGNLVFRFVYHNVSTG
jgi:predicted PurR-regulated permease PerM